MALAMIALLLLLGGATLTTPAAAGPGDPRFLQGTLEWPPTLIREPVIIVRGDDGHAYYCDVTEAARHLADDLRAGGRISLLGLQAARPHELTAIVIGTGDAAALARALSQGVARPAAAGDAATGAASPAPAVTVSPTGPAPSAAPAPAPPPVATPAPSAAPGVVIMAPGSPAATPAPGPGHAIAPGIVPATGTPVPAVATAPPPPRRSIAPAAPGAAGGRGQWSRLDGMVESVAGSTLTLKTPGGALAYVDISQLSPGVAQVLRQGTAVTVYGYPLEQTFEAAGYIQTNAAGPEPRTPAATSR
jgi:hypothetical protein